MPGFIDGRRRCQVCTWPPVSCHEATTARSLHPGGANFLLGDGSVHFYNASIDYMLYNQLGTRAGGESVSPP